MLTLKQAMALHANEIESLKEQMIQDIKAKQELNAYIETPELNENDKGKIPILIKDNICVKDSKLTCASKILHGYVSPYSATAVTKLQDSNMCAFGRANMDEFGMGSTTEKSCYGRTKNPIDTSRVPGGSSGGSAAAVAAKIAIASLGSDTGGSIRQPASYCGVVGLKPTYGRVSRYGLVAYSSSLEQIGPITQNVEDASILLDIISGVCKRDSTNANLAPTKTFDKLNSKRILKIAILEDFVKEADEAVQKAYYDTIKILEDMGHSIIKAQMLDTTHHISAYYIIAMAEASANLARFDGVRYGGRIEGQNLQDLYFKTRAQFGDEVQKRILLGSFVLSSGYYDAYYLKAQKVRELIRQQYASIFSECDTILLPVAPNVAPTFNATKSSLEMYLSDIYTIGVNLAGLPAISLPVVKSPLPIGMQFIGSAFSEQTILDVAFGLEQNLGI
ncbi:Asp-tRNA(Asn)/Glu-tRNA(Gln) amidotransferase subunit GatA [Helicobacter bilis]|uniref:Asp-tRNA(Asn)/Glu-tRNA(Gln) amidotransferase subunit GatA n=1 Tax=Helicobacter bilis TaxID=37372 RepID=UPI002557FF8F|nr:Asp-tRNA(Asn)/Glu-tRNA(Gln) amidotransferase subunit GatA [Helicobacter bilis]